MFGFLVRKGCQILALAFLVASVPLDHACAGTFMFNADPQNNTGTSANDLEIGLRSTSAIDVGGVWEHTSEKPMVPTVAFPSYTIIFNNNPTLTINYYGATIPDGDWTHVGAYGTAVAAPTVTSAYWTEGGFPINGGSIPFPSVSFVNYGAVDFGVVRATMYNPQGLVINTVWYEGPADPGSSSFASLFNSNPGTPTIYVSWAFNTPSPTPIPIQDLNENLTGFGPESSIHTLSIPEPSSLLMLELGLGLCGCVLHGKRGRAASHRDKR